MPVFPCLTAAAGRFVRATMLFILVSALLGAWPPQTRAEDCVRLRNHCYLVHVRSLDFSPDGEQLYLSLVLYPPHSRDKYYSIVRLDHRTDEPLQPIHHTCEWWPEYLTVSDDGRLLAFSELRWRSWQSRRLSATVVDRETRITLIDLAEGETRHIRGRPGPIAYNPFFDPDGNGLYFLEQVNNGVVVRRFDFAREETSDIYPPTVRHLGGGTYVIDPPNIKSFGTPRFIGPDRLLVVGENPIPEDILAPISARTGIDISRYRYHGLYFEIDLAEGSFRLSDYNRYLNLGRDRHPVEVAGSFRLVGNHLYTQTFNPNGRYRHGIFVFHDGQRDSVIENLKISAIAVSPNGGRVAYTESFRIPGADRWGTNRLYLRDMANGETREFAFTPANLRELRPAACLPD